MEVNYFWYGGIGGDKQVDISNEVKDKEITFFWSANNSSIYDWKHDGLTGIKIGDKMAGSDNRERFQKEYDDAVRSLGNVPPGARIGGVRGSAHASTPKKATVIHLKRLITKYDDPTKLQVIKVFEANIDYIGEYVESLTNDPRLVGSLQVSLQEIVSGSRINRIKFKVHGDNNEFTFGGDGTQTSDFPTSQSVRAIRFFSNGAFEIVGGTLFGKVPEGAVQKGYANLPANGIFTLEKLICKVNERAVISYFKAIIGGTPVEVGDPAATNKDVILEGNLNVSFKSITHGDFINAIEFMVH